MGLYQSDMTWRRVAESTRTAVGGNNRTLRADKSLTLGEFCW